MERIGDLMRNLGFREEGSDDVKKAFIRNLIRAAAANRPPAVESLHEPVTQPQPHLQPETPKVITEEQLSFQFEPMDDVG